MIDDIRRLLERRSFAPFTVVTSSGEKYLVASRDHAGFDPHGKRLLIWFDDSSHVTLASLHIVALEEGASASTSNQPDPAAS